MLGAIIGDIVGSRFEWHNLKSKEFELFAENCQPTDDSIMTLAVAEAILNSREQREKLSELAVYCMVHWGNRYPRAGYGGHFRQWLREGKYVDIPEPYYSLGNGAAMRVSPCGFAAASMEEAIALADAVTAVTHNHPEGMRGAEATTAAIFLAREGKSIPEIRAHIEDRYYKIDFTLDEIRPDYTFDVTCQGSVPQALEAFFESASFEDAIRGAISIGGDSDTIAAITGGIAEAYYGIPEEIRAQALSYLKPEQRSLVERFYEAYPGTL